MRRLSDRVFQVGRVLLAFDHGALAQISSTELLALPMIHLLANVKDELSQPYRCRILDSPKRIEQIFLVLSGIDGRGEHEQRKRLCQRLRQTLGNECDDVGFGRSLKGLQIAGDAQSNIPRQPFLPEPGVDWVFHQPLTDNSHVVRVEECSQRFQPRCGRMSFARDRNLRVGEEGPAPESRNFIRGAGNKQINGACPFPFYRRGRLPGQNFQPDCRCGGMNSFDQSRHDEVGDVILHHQRKAAFAGYGFKRIRNQKSVDSLQRLGQWVAQTIGPRCQLHPRPNPHQQRISQQVPEAIQGVACCWLGKPNFAGGTAYVHFRDERVQCNQQIQINRR
jgi:hypothetical protein